MIVVAGADTDKAAPLGLLVLVVLCVVCYFLFKSMSGHLRKVRDEWPDSTPKPSTDAGTEARKAVADKPTAEAPTVGESGTADEPADPPAPPPQP